jgi:hypothetical protein
MGGKLKAALAQQAETLPHCSMQAQRDSATPASQKSV